MLKTNLFEALRVAERAALEHVRWLRKQGVPLAEAAAAIGLDPDNARTWDAITQVYVLAFLGLTPADSARHKWPGIRRRASAGSRSSSANAASSTAWSPVSAVLRAATSGLFGASR